MEAQNDLLLGGSDRKRSKRSFQDDENQVEDILGQITSKLNLLSTNEDNRKSDSVLVFTEVLGCTTSDAVFYLESSAWNIESAVSIWLEYNSLRVVNSAINNQENDYGLESAVVSIAPRDLWIEKEVEINGLDPSWSAKVDAHTGHIYFQHKLTRVRQPYVPFGLADRTLHNSNDKLQNDKCHSYPKNDRDQHDSKSYITSLTRNYDTNYTEETDDNSKTEDKNNSHKEDDSNNVVMNLSSHEHDSTSQKQIEHEKDKNKIQNPGLYMFGKYLSQGVSGISNKNDGQLEERMDG